MCSEARENCHDNVFDGLLVGPDEPSLVGEYLNGHDFADNTFQAIRNDLRKFASWFVEANRERFAVKRITVRDVVDFRNHLHRDQKQAVASVNRCLVSIRRFIDHLVRTGYLQANPARQVKELRRQPLAPKGLPRDVVRRLLREVELRGDLRASAVFHMFLFTGARVSDLVNLEMPDVMMTERAGTATYRRGKGNKVRTVPLPLPARKVLTAYLETRPPMNTDHVFVGERGGLTAAGVQSLCRKYSALIGVHLHPHLLRHTFSKRFLEDNANDIVSLAQILGHENIQTTARYSQRDQQQLNDAAENVNY
jgi:site-specific recombinase XerD